DGLRRCPPDAPIDLVALFDNSRVRLRWTAPPPDSLGPVSYKVLRKRLGRPSHAADGTVVAEVTGTECDDPAPPAGDTVGYEVYSRRAEVDSLAGSAVGPFLILTEVTNLQIESESREVHLSWTAPTTAAEIKVVRKAGASPTGPDDGQAISAGREGTRDR